jgi:hypothetical protein
LRCGGSGRRTAPRPDGGRGRCPLSAEKSGRLILASRTWRRHRPSPFARPLLPGRSGRAFLSLPFRRRCGAGRLARCRDGNARLRTRRARRGLRGRAIDHPRQDAAPVGPHGGHQPRRIAAGRVQRPPGVGGEARGSILRGLDRRSPPATTMLQPGLRRLDGDPGLAQHGEDRGVAGTEQGQEEVFSADEAVLQPACLLAGRSDQGVAHSGVASSISMTGMSSSTR